MALELLSRVPEGGLEPWAAERLQQVIERVDLEGLQRILVVGGHEDDGGHAVGSERLADGEPVHRRHLNVEEDEIGRIAPDGLEGLGAVRALPDHLDVRLLAEQRHEARAGHRLIVDDEGPDFWSRGLRLRVGRRARARRSENGIATRTAEPRPRCSRRRS